MNISFYEEDGRLIIVIDNPSKTAAELVKGMLGEATKLTGLEPAEKELPKKPEIPGQSPVKNEAPEKEQAPAKPEPEKKPEQEKKPEPVKGEEKKPEIPKAVQEAFALMKNKEQMKEIGMEETIRRLYPACRKAADTELKKLGAENLNTFISSADGKNKKAFLNFVFAECKKNEKMFCK